MLGRWLGHHFGKRSPAWHSVCHFEELEEVMEAVATGRGVAVVPDVCVAPWRRSVKAITWRKPPLVNRVLAVRRAREPARPVVQALVDAVRSSGTRSASQLASRTS